MADLFVTIATVFAILSCSYDNFSSAPESISATQSSSNITIANLASMQIVMPIADDEITLDGSKSSGANGAPVYEFHWTNLDFTASSPPFAVGQTVITIGEKFSFSIDQFQLHSGIYHFELFVVDEGGGKSDSVIAEVRISGLIASIQSELVGSSF